VQVFDNPFGSSTPERNGNFRRIGSTSADYMARMSASGTPFFAGNGMANGGLTITSAALPRTVAVTIGERLRTGEYERDRIEKTPQFAGIIFNLWFMRDVGAMERYYARLVPLLDKRKQVHARMAEVNVHQISSVAAQQ